MKGHQAEGTTKVTQTQGIVCISPVNPVATYHIPVSLHGHSCSFLIDIGAAISLINSTVWEKCCSAPRQDIHMELAPWQQQRLVGVNGSPLHVRGSLSTLLTIGNHKWNINLVVVDELIEEGILGLDFLQRYGCVIDFRLQTL